MQDQINENSLQLPDGSLNTNRLSEIAGQLLVYNQMVVFMFMSAVHPQKTGYLVQMQMTNRQGTTLALNSNIVCEALNPVLNKLRATLEEAGVNMAEHDTTIEGQLRTQYAAISQNQPGQ